MSKKGKQFIAFVIVNVYSFRMIVQHINFLAVTCPSVVMQPMQRF